MGLSLSTITVRKTQSLEWREHKAYLCGPPVMIDAAISTLMQSRLFERDIHTERFLSAADGASGHSRSALFKYI